MPYTPILATLGYVFSPCSEKVLLVHRTARPDDAHYGKYNGLGGKLERDEDVAAGMRRELREEAGIEADLLQLAGTISWPGFGKKGEDWFGFLFRVLKFSGTPKPVGPEGPLEWVEISRVLDLPLWEGDRLFLPLVFDHFSPPFHGVMPYANGRPTGWALSTV
ncbi:MAG TPA: 8-oxo-dGTP diphosphatase [Fimbriiglobus sp.]|jgi:8-oxo-dGTP diphosphatase